MVLDEKLKLLEILKERGFNDSVYTICMIPANELHQSFMFTKFSSQKWMLRVDTEFYRPRAGARFRNDLIRLNCCERQCQAGITVNRDGVVIKKSRIHLWEQLD